MIQLLYADLPRNSNCQPNTSSLCRYFRDLARNRRIISPDVIRGTFLFELNIFLVIFEFISIVIQIAEDDKQPADILTHRDYSVADGSSFSS